MVFKNPDSMSLWMVTVAGVLCIGCAARKQNAGSLGPGCNGGEHIEIGSQLAESFAFENYGDATRTWGRSVAISVELLDRPSRLTEAELMRGLTLRAKVVNRLGRPVWLLDRRHGDLGFQWEGEGILEPLRKSDSRLACEELSIIPARESKTVSVRLGGPYVHIVRRFLGLRVVYRMWLGALPLPPRDTVPVIGQVESEKLEITIETDTISR